MTFIFYRFRISFGIASINETLKVPFSRSVVGYEDRGNNPIHRVTFRHISNFPRYAARKALQELRKRGLNPSTSRPQPVGR